MTSSLKWKEVTHASNYNWSKEFDLVISEHILEFRFRHSHFNSICERVVRKYCMTHYSPAFRSAANSLANRFHVIKCDSPISHEWDYIGVDGDVISRRVPGVLQDKGNFYAGLAFCIVPKVTKHG